MSLQRGNVAIFLIFYQFINFLIDRKFFSSFTFYREFEEEKK